MWVIFWDVDKANRKPKRSQPLPDVQFPPFLHGNLWLPLVSNWMQCTFSTSSRNSQWAPSKQAQPHTTRQDKSNAEMVIGGANSREKTLMYGFKLESKQYFKNILGMQSFLSKCSRSPQMQTGNGGLRRCTFPANDTSKSPKASWIREGHWHLQKGIRWSCLLMDLSKPGFCSFSERHKAGSRGCSTSESIRHQQSICSREEK